MHWTFQYLRQVWTRFVQSITIHKIAIVSFFIEDKEIVNENIEYQSTKNKTLGDPSQKYLSTRLKLNQFLHSDFDWKNN